MAVAVPHPSQSISRSAYILKPFVTAVRLESSSAMRWAVSSGRAAGQWFELDGFWLWTPDWDGPAIGMHRLVERDGV